MDPKVLHWHSSPLPVGLPEPSNRAPAHDQWRAFECRRASHRALTMPRTSWERFPAHQRTASRPTETVSSAFQSAQSPVRRARFSRNCPRGDIRRSCFTTKTMTAGSTRMQWECRLRGTDSAMTHEGFFPLRPSRPLLLRSGIVTSASLSILSIREDYRTKTGLTMNATSAPSLTPVDSREICRG